MALSQIYKQLADLLETPTSKLKHKNKITQYFQKEGRKHQLAFEKQTKMDFYFLVHGREARKSFHSLNDKYTSNEFLLDFGKL